LSLSATMVYPDVCIMSKLVQDVKFPVAKNPSSQLQTVPPCSMIFFKYSMSLILIASAFPASLKIYDLTVN